MTLRLVFRSLLAQPLRSAALAGGFGFGISVMAVLLGVGEIVLEQARAPELEGGGDMVVRGAAGQVDSARFVISAVIGQPGLAGAVEALAPSRVTTLYLGTDDGPQPVLARGGIPSLDRAIGNPEVAQLAAWTDTAADRAWVDPADGEVLRAMDRFHPVPDAPRWADSWAEWLYFNGSWASGRLYLTFLVGPDDEAGRRPAMVRLQLEWEGRRDSYSKLVEIDGSALDHAPDIDIGGNRVRLEGTRYRLSLDLRREVEGSYALDDGVRHADGPDAYARGELVLTAVPGRSLPPLTVRGREGWLSGYVVPVLSGTLEGRLRVDGRRLELENARGYHDHNWGFWSGVSWQWGQVAHDDLSVVYGRIRPPPDAGDAERLPGFLGLLGPAGPLGFSTSAIIDEADHPELDRPQRITVRARSPSLDLVLELEVDEEIRTPGALRGGLDFLQMRGRYRVRGSAGGRQIDFTARGSAETFRGRRAPARRVNR